MARTMKARSQAVDNIAVGSAITTHERTIAGQAPSTVTDTWGNTENIAVGTDYSADENIIAVGTNLILTERLG